VLHPSLVCDARCCADDRNRTCSSQSIMKEEL
jgi:hypothetical protein